MTTEKSSYLAYATTGKEFDVEEQLASEGFDVWCGKSVSFIRRGKRRRPDVVILPKLPNYIFLSIDADEWHRLHAKRPKHMAGTMYALRRDDMREVERFKALADMEHERGLKIAERNDKAEMVQFERGQKLIDVQGRFGDTIIRFRRMIERAHDFHPVIEAEMEMMGRVITVELDPLDVKGV